jgi:hypothetical protein
MNQGGDRGKSQKRYRHSIAFSLEFVKSHFCLSDHRSKLR